MPRRRAPDPPPKRRSPNTGSVRWIEKRQRWRARLPQHKGEAIRESWHLTKDEAEAWIVREMARDEESFDPARSLREYLAYWLDLRGEAWGPQTRRRYAFEAQVLGSLRSVALYRLRGDRVQATQKRLLERGLSRRYVYNVMALLRRALADAVKWKILTENVVDTVTLPSPEDKPTRAWEIEEAQAVLKAIVGQRFEACYLLILWGGLRIGEVVGLRWSQIGDDGVVAFQEAEHTHLKGRPIGTTKRNRSRETCLPAHVAARLRELREAGPPPVAWPGRRNVGVAFVYVAQRPDGQRWHPRTIRDDWIKLIEGVKHGGEAVTPLRPHGGRKTFGTQHMVAGTALADLASLMGHSSPATTASSYLATSKTRKMEAAERLADLLEPERGTRKGLVKGQAKS